MRSIRTVAAAALVPVLALVLAACGSSSSTSSTASSSSASSFGSPGYPSPLTESLTTGKRGGTLTVLDESDFEHLDPGISYFSLDYPVVFATQRPLYSQKPNETSPTPDMASGMPEISTDGKTVTVHIKEGVDFSPPVNREVTSEDVAYAMERGANPDVANPYFQSYFKSIEGAPNATGAVLKINTKTKASSAGNPTRIRSEDVIAIGVPKPAMPSSSAPKQKPITTSTIPAVVTLCRCNSGNSSPGSMLAWS